METPLNEIARNALQEELVGAERRWDRASSAVQYAVKELRLAAEDMETATREIWALREALGLKDRAFLPRVEPDEQ